MPLYEYQCDACGHRFEKIVKFSDPPLEKCPVCGGHVHKLISSPAFQFKGTGWYVTDYAKKDHVSGGKTGESSGDSSGKDKSGGEKKDGGGTSEKNEKSGSSEKGGDKSDKGSSSSDSSSSSSTTGSSTSATGASGSSDAGKGGTKSSS